MNNKYLIEFEISIEENFSNYVVTDIEENKKYELCVLKNDFAYEKIREYLLSKFKTIRNLNFDNVVNIIKIETIYSMNGIKLDKPQYSYLIEYIESKIDIQSYLNECTQEEKLDIFMKLCAAINTLNMQGYIFDDITIKDIVLIPDSNNIHVKIKDLLRNEISKFNLLNSAITSLPYQYNIQARNDGTLSRDNIVQVINMFNQMFTEDDLKNNLKELNYIKKIYNQAKTINKSFKLRYFIKDLNHKMHKNYELFITSALNKLETDIDIVGMDEEIKIVEKNFQKILENKQNYKIISFIGDDGSGKSRLLEEIRYKFEKKYFKDIIYTSDFSDKKMDSKDKYNNLINYIYSRIDKNLKDKYEIYINKFIQTLFEKDSIKNEEKQLLQLINRIGKFINEYTLTTPFVIIIDNFNESNEVFQLFIRYIAFLGNSLENVMIILSINESKSSERFLRFIKELKALEQYEEYKINFFNQYNTTKMIKSMLNINQELNKLTVKIYSETLGNPQYISSVVKELYANNTLYFDESLGEWRTNIAIKEILIPKNLEKRLEMNISSLNPKEINVLKRLSIFETPLSEKLILKYVIHELENIEVYKMLKSKEFLADKISDKGILIGFTNNLLRNIIYLKISEEEKIELHTEAAILFEEILFETDYYIEEFLIHLERSYNYEKAYFYTMKYAKVQDLLGRQTKSIYYYKKALQYPSNSNGSEIAINIARLYEKSSEHEKGYEYFEKANQFAVQNDEVEIQVYTLLEMIIIKIHDITDRDTGIDYFLSCVRRLLDLKFYPKGEVYYYYALSVKYRLEYNHKLVYFNAERALIIAEQNKINEDICGWVTTVLVGVNLRNGKYEDAKRLCLSAIEIFINNNNINGQLSSKLLYTSICKEEEHSVKDVLEEYSEITRLANKYKVYKKEILSLIYISKIYIQEKKYEEAEEHLLRALEREREEGIDAYSFKICNALCLLYIKLGKIKLAAQYYYLVNQMQMGIKLLEEEVIDSNYTYALYNLLICNYDTAYHYLKRIYTLIFNTTNNSYKSIVCNYYELMLLKCKNEVDIKNVYQKLDDKIKKIQNTEIELEIRIMAIRRILLLGYFEFAKDLFLNLEGYPTDNSIEGIYIYLEFSFKCKNHYNFLINKALRICTLINNQEIKADIYTSIGERYRELECYSLAINYYYESIALHMDIINLLPLNDKLVYINNSGFLKTRNLFIICLNRDLDIKIKYKKIDFIKKEEEIIKILNELNLTNIFKNEAVYRLMQNSYEKSYNNEMRDFDKVLDGFTSETIDNIKVVMKYLARLTLADRAMIVTENINGENDVICTYRISNKNEIDRYFSLKVDSEEDTFVICNNDSRLYQLNDRVLADGIKSCMYMKIINRENNINSSARINARLILITNNAVNNINVESKKIIEKFKPFLIFLLEKHYLTISSTLDKLTGVYNRKYFEEALILLLENAKLEKKEFAVIMFDIDDFKEVNDRYGHQTGDETLVKLTREVKKCIRKDDIIGRYGGEEFIVLLPNINKEIAINMAEKIRETVEGARILGDKRQVTISIGVAMSTSENLNNEVIIKRADQALYQAKNQGKNRYVFWENEYGISVDINNNLTGVLSGNATKDYNFASSIKAVANLVKARGNKEEKIYQYILNIMQFIDCETTTLFIVKDKKIINTFSKERSKEGWYVVEKFNFDLIYDAIEKEQGTYLVDWESMNNYNQNGIPDWRSICLTPIICNGEVLAVIYLAVSVNKKEFTCNDYNILNCFADIGIPIFFNN